MKTIITKKKLFFLNFSISCSLDLSLITSISNFLSEYLQSFIKYNQYSHAQIIAALVYVSLHIFCLVVPTYT